MPKPAIARAPLRAPDSAPASPRAPARDVTAARPRGAVTCSARAGGEGRRGDAAMLSVAARAGPFAPFVSAAAHAVPGPLRPLAPAAAHRDRKVPLEPKRLLLCRESLSGRAARGGLVASTSLNGAGRGSGGGRAAAAGAATGLARALPALPGIARPGPAGRAGSGPAGGGTEPGRRAGGRAAGAWAAWGF